MIKGVGRARDRRGSDDDRGAVLPLVALTLVTLITMSALTIDLGRLMIVRRDLQAAADVVSLDLARLLPSRAQSTASAITSDPAWCSQMITSASRNRVPIATCTDPKVVAVVGKSAGKGSFTAAAATDTGNNAVQVTMTDGISYFFAQVIGQSSGTATRSAVSGTGQHACFSVGSYAAAITTSGSVLGGFLSFILTGSSGTISLASYSGLAGTSLTLLDLLHAQNSVGTVDELLTSSYTADQYRVLTAKALRNKGDIANATILEGLSFAAAGSSKTTVGNLLNVQAGDSPAASATFNALDLLAGSAYIATGGNFVNVPGINVANVSNVSLKLIEPPQLGCSPRTARTSQVALKVTVSIPLVSTIDLSFAIAPATATFGGAVCASPRNTATVNVASSLLTPHIKVTALLGTVLADTDLAPTTEGGGSPIAFTIDRTVANPTGSMPPAPTQTKSTGSGTLGIENTSFGATVAGPVATSLTVVLNALVAPLLDPLQSAVGLSVGGADVTLREFDCQALALLK